MGKSLEKFKESHYTRTGIKKKIHGADLTISES
jgi:hypothetical protein